MIKLKLSLIFVIISLINVKNGAPQSANCVYSFINDYGYTCKLTILHADASTHITGQHMRGVNDESVNFISTSDTNSNSTIIPADLCEKFKNAVTISMNNIGLEEIYENSFRNCKKLSLLHLTANKIKKIAKNALASQFKLKRLWLNDNQLTKLDQKLFANLKNLETLRLDENHIKMLPDGIFSSLINLEFLHLHNNKLSTLHYALFTDAVRTLSLLTFNGNKMTSMDERIINNMHDLMEIKGHSNPCTTTTNEYVKDTEAERPNINAYLEDCFDNYEIFAYVEMSMDGKIQNLREKIEKLSEKLRNFEG